ncbi:MAG: undecaprenyldiphospho-muramoylpentapeptide beta-N-acetylglucosaminyltransferase [Mogibacterium sp.]|nr:undecaprenyldiphospho-muramoylpentapeptide beta-N-acetylglucosaminyltransferase [Mogibacterium sp.]
MRIVLTGGVTGGHIYPAIAIGDKFKDEIPDSEIIYIASGNTLEKEIIPGAGYELFEVQSEPFYRNNIFKMAGTLSKTLKGRKEALKILRDFKPDAIVSTGSYISAPVVLAGAALKTKIYLHEQNGFPGVSNKFLARYANKVFLGFESAWTYFKDQTKLVYSGNPVRKEFSGRSRADDRTALDLDRDDFIIVVFGGSQGSETTNTVGEALAREYADKEGFTVVWGTGKAYYDDITKRLEEEFFEASNVRIVPYISDMPAMLSACDLIVSRSGALSVAETTMAGRVAVFIPSPNVTEDHQYYNAKSVADAGGAYIVREDKSADEVAEEVREIVHNLSHDRDLLRSMEEASGKLAPLNATDIIYNTIMEDFPKPAASDEEQDEEEPESASDEQGDVREDNHEDDHVDDHVDERQEVLEDDYKEKTIVFEKKETENEPEPEPETPEEDKAESDKTEEGSESEEAEETVLADEDLAIAERIRLRKIETSAKYRRQRRRLVTTVVLAIALITGVALSFTSLFTVDLIEVRGNSNFSAEEIISMAHASPGKNIIYHPDKEIIKENLELNPYIESADVSRKLPSTLVITVKERQQMMALKYDDDYLILDREGILLQKSRTKPKLTLIEGNTITRIKLGQQLGTGNEDLLQKSIGIMQTMADNDLYYVKVDMSDLSNIKAYVYDTLIVRTDYDTLIKNMENGRLHQVLDKLFEDSIKRGTITFVDEETVSFMPTF